jgi:hypothetical protein
LNLQNSKLRGPAPGAGPLFFAQDHEIAGPDLVGADAGFRSGSGAKEYRRPNADGFTRSAQARIAMHKTGTSSF